MFKWTRAVSSLGKHATLVVITLLQSKGSITPNPIQMSHLVNRLIAITLLLNTRPITPNPIQMSHHSTFISPAVNHLTRSSQLQSSQPLSFRFKIKSTIHKQKPLLSRDNFESYIETTKPKPPYHLPSTCFEKSTVGFSLRKSF